MVERKEAMVMERRAGDQGCNWNQALWKINIIKTISE